MTADRPEATAEAIDKDGWLNTGDMASIDEEGFLYIRDRAKDIIIRGGENVSHSQVEADLRSLPPRSRTSSSRTTESLRWLLSLSQMSGWARW